jgi:hypothetical protein
MRSRRSSGVNLRDDLFSAADPAGEFVMVAPPSELLFAAATDTVFVAWTAAAFFAERFDLRGRRTISGIFTIFAKVSKPAAFPDAFFCPSFTLFMYERSSSCAPHDPTRKPTRQANGSHRRIFDPENGFIFDFIAADYTT